jgi:glycosyltransferase involved in cell wall biosynthesis
MEVQTDMRVLIVHNRYRLVGGEERHISLLHDELARVGVDVDLLTVDSGSVGSSVRSRIALAAGMVYRPRMGRMLKQRLADSPADVVHFHNIQPLLTTAALRAARKSGAAVVMTLHNYRFACPAGTLLRGTDLHDDCLDGSSLACALRNARGTWSESIAYGVAIELQRRLRLLQRWVDAFVTPSRFLAAAAARAGLPAAAIHPIAYGVPLGNGHDRGGRKHALFAGRISSEKGIATLVEAAKLSGVPVLVAGDGPLKSSFAEQPGVRLPGHLSGDALERARDDAAFVVVPSECHEVLPFSALEAAAVGKPIVATRVGGLPEIVTDGHNGLLVDPRSPAALAAAMRRLWENPDFADELGMNAKRRAESAFSLETQTRAVVRLYEEVARS